ncbi:hypothetical protein C1701_20440 [Actinoalloteichus sp. AHMU CJ021]|uniref:Uncharacterized protein n=1 Tax=Actinoalloteichus caeruleus DSM 43889 TaxID=1120930 RepID=A0ABT1JQW4_ACTCY|nr:hypothetical protein [Actinoalloteichus caeruleus]AUS80309.1 hypothetical protein C1701_20440 [Actinoalloteichus sp. AHMU CJ021]MCP2334559.1 hypothetical protein [Actinoalloteichus caeruleus DSM 43889]
MADIEQRVVALRAEAESGDAGAAAELGRLLCVRPALSDADDVEDLWPSERWLRAALRERPGDSVTTNLLASRLVQQIDAIHETDLTLGEESARDGVERRRSEALALYDRVLDVNVADPAASAGLAALRAAASDEEPSADELRQSRYSWYLVEVDTGSGAVSYVEQLVVTDPDELRWACDRFFHTYGSLAGTTLMTFQAGEEDERIELAELGEDAQPHWDTVRIPPLRGEPLPVAHPVRVGRMVSHYGYTVHAYF